MTRRMLAQISQALELSPETARRFEEQITKTSRAKSNSAATEAAPKKDFHQLSADSYHFISDWYHYAILELLRLKDFEPDTKRVAYVLGITPHEVNLALERMQRLDLIRVDHEKNAWINIRGNHSNVQPGDFTTAALRKLQRQVLQKAIEALEEIPLGERDQSSITFAMDSSQMPRAITEIQKFRRALCQKLDRGGPYDRVYQLSVSLYPVTRRK